MKLCLIGKVWSLSIPKGQICVWEGAIGEEGALHYSIGQVALCIFNLIDMQLYQSDGLKPPKLGDAIRESSIWFQCSILSLLYQVIADRLQNLMISCSFLTASKFLRFNVTMYCPRVDLSFEIFRFGYFYFSILTQSLHCLLVLLSQGISLLSNFILCLLLLFSF